MVFEMARFNINPGMESQFEQGVSQALPIFKRAQGCLGVTLQRSVESPSHFLLIIRWATLENHTVDFRSSPDFQAWRALVGHCFTDRPQVEHMAPSVEGF